jgi:pyruvate-ferredoxin/flavodoxin oxidoreductase
MKKVMDGNEAAAYVSYAFTEIAAIYPITPSSPMAEKTDEWSAGGRKNIFGQTVTLTEMQSEAGAIGALHGALEAGAYATSYTSSQGLLLMIPVMHRIAGSRLPAVLHVASRTVGTHAMSIFGDHSDVMNCRQTGFAMLSSASVQEVMDMGAIAHLTAIKCGMPFMHFFDGFRTSHEIQKIDVLDYSDLSGMADYNAIDSFKHGALNPEHPTLRNTVQNPDIYFQVREANNIYYDMLPGATLESMRMINELTGNSYGLFNYHGAPDAEIVIVAMGSVSGPIRETVDMLNGMGEKTGFVQVHLYRPFSTEHFLEAMPGTVKTVAVLDRTKESGAVGEPLYEDICAVYTNKRTAPRILGGRYGLSSKDTAPKHIKAVFDNMQAKEPRNHFTIGIVDDVNHLSLDADASFTASAGDVRYCKFWGLGSDGTVGANKNAVKIIGDNTENYVQAYFEYDTKKSFGVTKSHLRIGKRPIMSSYLVKEADFVACHNQSYIGKYDIVSEIQKGGTFLLNCDYAVEDLERKLPPDVKRYLAINDIAFYIIDANRISRDLGLSGRINIVLQAAFFKLFDIIPLDEAVCYMKQAIEATYGKKGDKVVEKNIKAIEAGLSGLMEVNVPQSWARSSDAPFKEANEKLPEFIEKILIPINAQKGDDLPVSVFAGCSDGTMPLGTSAFEKRGIATVLPKWEKANCLQCNRCALVCPHAAIRPYLLDENERVSAPAGFGMISGVGKGSEPYAYSLQISDLDCTGCGSCADVCPAKEKALNMIPRSEKMYSLAHWEYGLSLSVKEDAAGTGSVKASQFRQPLYEFSGACAGCGETPYAKLLTQLFGDRMFWVNATGCSQAWGASMPSIPYTKDRNGHGPAWSNSLFENNAEFAFGMLLSSKQQRMRVKEKIIALKESLLKTSNPAAYKGVLQAISDWLETFDDLWLSSGVSRKLTLLLSSLLTCKDAELHGLAAGILNHSDQFAKKTVWMFGGDGWAYDIGYGGLDHVVATGEDINVFVVDTEVYSNTGGQSSKATPLGAVAQFQSSGKKIPKKDIGKQMMAYGNVYVASVSMGADPGQLLTAINEAESYPGPSVIIAYTPCIVHGIKAGMEKVQDEMKRAVESGYWTLYRFDPRKGQPFQLDSKKRSLSYREFLDGEVRYASLAITYPENAERLFTKAEQESEKNFEAYKIKDESKSGDRI